MFQFKQFLVKQDRCAMKVTTDSCLFGAWAAHKVAESPAGEKFIILDIGAGTGLLSLMMAQQIPGAWIDAVEIDESAYAQAAENFSSSPWSGRLRALHGDARNLVFENKYDVIISNPPFYENELSSGDPARKTAHHDSGLKLGEALSIIAANLSADGRFYLLLPYKRNKEVNKAVSDAGLEMRSIVLVKQTPRHGYFRMMIEGSHTSAGTETSFEELTIKNEPGEYSTPFADLLKDYYLYL